MNQFTKLSIIATMAAATCEDKPGVNCSNAYAYACEHQAGISQDCPASCLAHNNGPNAASLPQTCEGWFDYTPGGSGPDDDCKDDESSGLCESAWSSACKNQDGVARSCPKTCASRVYNPKKPCSYWKTYYPGGGSDTCKDESSANCVALATAYNCEQKEGVSQKCPVSCVSNAPQYKRTCEEWKVYTPTTTAAPTEKPTVAPTVAPTTTVPSTTTVTTTESTTTQPGVPPVPEFPIPAHPTLSLDDFTTTKTPAGQQAGVGVIADPKLGVIANSQEGVIAQAHVIADPKLGVIADPQAGVIANRLAAQHKWAQRARSSPKMARTVKAGRSAQSVATVGLRGS